MLTQSRATHLWITVLIATLVIVLGLAGSPVLAADNGWNANFYGNTGFAGDPIAPNVYYPYLNYDWGGSAPTDASGAALAVPADEFSAIFTSTRSFAEGVYTFHIRVNDGIMVYVDDALVLTQFTPLLFPYGDYEVPVTLTAGEHTVQVWYVDYTGNAIIEIDWGGDTALALSPDSRFCFGAGEATAAVYVVSSGYQVYGVNSADKGWLALNITNDDLEALPVALDKNMQVATSKDGKIVFYKLTSGEYQVNVGPDFEGKTHVCTFSPGSLKGARVTSFK